MENGKIARIERVYKMEGISWIESVKKDYKKEGIIRIERVQK